MEIETLGSSQEAPDVTNPHMFTFICDSVGIVHLKGARERWIAPAAMHICSAGIEDLVDDRARDGNRSSLERCGR